VLHLIPGVDAAHIVALTLKSAIYALVCNSYRGLQTVFSSYAPELMLNGDNPATEPYIGSCGTHQRADARRHYGRHDQGRLDH